MQRDLYTQLLAWKNAGKRKPLILRGARQVGKTYLLKIFGQQEYANCIYINFEENPTFANFFKDDIKPIAILEKISIFTGQTIHPKKSLIIFDEIQESPEALNSLKYFQEHANAYHIVSAGSLLGIKLSSAKGFPVGKVNFLDLYPLNFFEFLAAIGKNKLASYLRQIAKFEIIAEPIHQELLVLLKKYMYIGGMPEAVHEYANSGNLLLIKNIHKEILAAYELDFAKHAPKEQIMKITEVWSSIPSQLTKENKKFIFSAIRKSARGRDYEEALQWLTDAGLIYKSYNIKVPKLPLTGYYDKQAFKVFMLDVGLLAAKSNIPASAVLDETGLFSEFNGAFTENYVAQTLSKLQQPLYYWTSVGIAELDFVVEHDLKIYPLEVKSGFSRKKKSLLVYADKYKPKYLLRTSLMNLKQDGKICNIPLYLLDKLINLLECLPSNK